MDAEVIESVKRHVSGSVEVAEYDLKICGQFPLGLWEFLVSRFERMWKNQ